MKTAQFVKLYGRKRNKGKDLTWKIAGRIMNKKYANNERVHWSLDEITRFLRVAQEDELGLFYCFVLSTGVRQGEVLALTWGDINFEQQTVTVRMEKTRKGSRILPLPSLLLAQLQKHKERQQLKKTQYGEQYHHQFELVFPDNDGGIQRPSTVRRQFYRLMAKANVSSITFHGLREMHAILLYKAGVSALTINNGLGLRSIDKLSINYIHLDQDKDIEKIKRQITLVNSNFVNE